jgi:hypothetical protein
MRLFAQISSRLWVVTLACACLFLVWTDQSRVRRVDYVSGLEGRARPVDALDAGSPTGYAEGQRELVIPERNEDSFDWIAETQQMFARGELRVRHVDFENAPFGREVNAASPYRWWLGLVAWLDHAASGRPIGLSVERAALYADPLLHLLAVVAATLFVAWRFGGFAAALLSLGAVFLYPFATLFLPGMPDQHGLSGLLALASILLLAAGTATPSRARIWLVLAGVAGGLGMWVSVQTEVPIVAGIAAGALLGAWIGRPVARRGAACAAVALPWRTWAFSGGVTVLAAYLAEYFPSHMGSWRMESVHPAYGLAWMGMGELLMVAQAWIQGEKPGLRMGPAARIFLSVAAVAAVPAIMAKTGGRGFLELDLLWARLSRLPGGAVAASSADWLSRAASAASAWATLLPLLALVPVAWLLFRAAARTELRLSLAVALGPVIAAGALACNRLGWWSVFDAAVLGLVVVAASGEWTLAGLRGRWITAAIALAAAATGLGQLVATASSGAPVTLTGREAQGLIERHLAHWLVKRTGEQGFVVFAPPQETVGMCFYGGLRGLGTFAPDNKAGFGATLGLAAVRTMEEAQAQIQARSVRYIVIPSWDPFFDEFAGRYLQKSFSSRPNFFVGELRRWNLPLWLRPVPYQIPVGGGFKGQSVLVFEVVDEQSPASAAGRLAEYLVETGDLEGAAVVSEGLRRFPGDVGALAAEAQVQGARGDGDGAARTLESLLNRLSSGGDRYLPWDRRVSLAIVLAQAGRNELSRDQVRRCFADANEARLRSLSTGSLYGLLVLGRAYGVEITDPSLRELSVGLLPDDVRSRL